MTDLLLKNYLNGSARERERETRAQAENSDQLQVPSLVSNQSSPN